MSDSGETGDGERLSDVEEIAAALRAGELDPDTRFVERRFEPEATSAEQSEGRTPAEILEEQRADDAETGSDPASETEPSTNRSGQGVVRAELTVDVDRDESGEILETIQNHLRRALAPEIPSDSIHVERVEGVTPTTDDLRVKVVVAIEAKSLVERALSESISDVSRDESVEILPS